MDYMRSLMWWVPTVSFYSPKGIQYTARRGDDLPHPGPQIIGLWVSGGPVRRKHGNHKIHLTTSFTDLFHRGSLITQNFKVFADDFFCGLLTETLGSLVCRPLLVQCVLVHPHFFLPMSSLPLQHVKGWS